MLNETIVALATPMMTSARAIIRISGKEALSLTNEIFSKDIYKLQPNVATYGLLTYKNETIILDWGDGTPNETIEGTVPVYGRRSSQCNRKNIQCVFRCPPVKCPSMA